MLGLALTACGETDGPLSGEQFSPYNRLVRDYKHLVSISYSGSSVRVDGPGLELVQVARDGARVTIQSSAKGVAYFVSGKSDDGQLRIESSQPYALYFNGLSLCSTQGPAVDSRCSANTYLVLCDKSTNTLSDQGAYDAPSACFYAEGRLILDGTGALTVTSTAEARYDAALGDTLRVHGITALRGVETPYAVKLDVTAPGGDGLYAADSTLDLGVGTYTLTAARHGLNALSGDVTLAGGSLYGTSVGGSFISTPSGRGLAVASGTCLVASTEATSVRRSLDDEDIYPAQVCWQQRVDSIAFTPDTTTTVYAYVEGGQAAQLTARPVAPLTSPYILLSTASLTSWAEVQIRY
jgi:hypothetical protein